MRVATAALGAASLLAPVAAGLAVFLDPLRSKKGVAGEMLRIATLDAVPDDGIPRRFEVVADRTDAWNKVPRERIGAVYLRRLPGENKVMAFNAVCPHAGCFVGYDLADDRFECPCHTSAFTLDGDVISPSPSPRGMDQLQTQVTDEGVVLVEFKNFYSGRATKDERQ